MKEKWKEYAGLILIIGLYYGGFMLLGFGCPIEFLTGIPCLGCGMTRAVFSLLTFDVSMAFYYHPCVFILPFAAAWLLCKNKMGNKLYYGGLCVIFALFVIAYLVRFFDPANAVIKLHLEEGFIYKTLRKLLSFLVVSLRLV